MKSIQIPQERLADFCQQHQIRCLALFGAVLASAQVIYEARKTIPA
jgi:hypothetical protein